MSTVGGRVAAAQFHAAPKDREGNLERAERVVRGAAAAGARLVVLPECCLSGYDLDWIAAGAPGGGQPVTGPGIAALRRLGAELRIAIVVNELERDGAALYLTSVVLDRGAVRTRHRKAHLTELEDAAGLQSGDRRPEVVAIDGLGVPLAPLVCFEHGFPELALAVACDGAGILAISSAIRRGSEYLRNLRTRARAQDNGAYAIAANAVGGDYCGESMIVDPRGEVVALASPDREEVVVADLDPLLVEAQRRAEPVLALRRPDLYR